MRRAAFLVAALTAAIAPAQAADVIKGKQLYVRHCAACHGATGVSIMPNAPNFARGERMLQPDQALLGAIRMGRGAMPSYSGVLNDRETLDVIAYMRTLR